jgi:tetratricopeptide (TPR) repeat protein
MGTPHYMAPEQVSGRTQDVDSRTDVYALGVILYELMAGRPPFEADTPAGVYYRILEQEPPRPSRITGRADADLELICLKAMSKDSAQRYPDALAFADDLHRYRNGEPVHARPPSVVYRLRKAIRRRSGILVTAAVAIVVMTGVVFVIGYAQFAAARDEATRAFTAKDWRTARDACRRALALYSDQTLAILQTECEARLKTETEEQRRRLDDAEDYRRLKERLGPIESAIKETRPWFYAKGVDIREKLKKIEAALEELSELARIPANDRQHELWALVGIGRYFLGDHVRAEQALLRSVDRGSKDGWVHYYLGRIYLERSMEARLVVNAALEEDNPPARELSNKAGREMARSLEAGVGAEEVDRVIVEAYRLMAEGNEPAALDKCEEGLRRFGGAMGAEEFWNLRGWLWGNDRERQEYAFTQAIERRPHDAFAHFMRSIARVMQGKTDEALADLDKALEVDPYLIAAYNNRGHIRIKRGDANGALADFNAGLRLSPNEAGLLCNRGKILLTIGDVKGALRDYNEAVRIGPQFYLAWLQRGVVHYGMGEFQKAFDDYTMAMKINPRAPEPYVDRGNIFRRWRKFDEAIADYEKALEVTSPRWEHRALVEKLLQQAKDGIEE